MGDNFTPTPSHHLRGQYTSVGLELIELPEPSDTFNLTCFLNITFYKLFNTNIYYLYLYGSKSFVLKNELYFIYFLIWFGLGWQSVIQY